MGLLDNGLFGSSMDDPRTMALLAGAGGMVNGGMGAGLLNYGQAYQGAQESALKRQDLAQQIQMRNIALQQQQQEWALQLPMLQAMAGRLNGQSQAAPGSPVTPSMPATQPTPGGALGSGTFGIPTGGQVPQQAAQGPQQGGSMFPGVPDNVAYPTAAFGGFKALLPVMSKYNEPTELMKTMTAAGMQPGSPEWNQAIRDNITKTNNIPLQAGRAGAPMYRADGSIAAMAPKIPDNAIPQIENGRVTGVSPLPGAANIAQINAFAGQAGKNQAEPQPGFIGNRPVFTNKLAAATGAQPSQPGDADRALILQTEMSAAQQRLAQLQSNPKAPPEAVRRAQEDVAGLTKEMQRSNIPAAEVAPSPQLGAPQGAVLSQEELSKKGAALMADNANTNTVISRLQNIKMLAPGAITGAEAPRRDFFNGLLSLAGIKGAEDAKTASDLVDKNSAQIVSALRMGQGGAGTDALQTLLSSANPNRHMTNAAIQEAADQLIASQKMIQDKAKVLNTHYFGRDPVAYGTKELEFDQNADPRVWQLQSMNPQQQAAYVKTLPPAVASELVKKLQSLKKIGVF